jgi:GNAT superfamily N-acetyltransferase
MISIRRAVNDADWQEAVALLHDHVEWMRAWTDFDPIAEQPSLLDELEQLDIHYRSGHAAMVLASWRSTCVGTIAIRCHDDGSAELKRMYVRPVARGRGVADRLVGVAVDFASEHGCPDVWLETVRGPMDPAIAVYRRNGFADAPARQATLGMPGILVMERRLPITSRCA